MVPSPDGDERTRTGADGAVAAPQSAVVQSEVSVGRQLKDTRLAKNLSANDQGYYLEVEAGRVDHANHDGNLHRTVTDGEAFGEAIAKAVSMVDTKDTLIIVTADHSHAINFNGYCGRGTPITGLCYEVDDNGIKHTGKPSVGLDGKPYTVGGYLNGAGSILHEDEATKQWSGARPDLTQEQATNPDYLQQALIPLPSETHSGEDVAVFATGPWSHLFRGVIEQNSALSSCCHSGMPASVLSRSMT